MKKNIVALALVLLITTFAGAQAIYNTNTSPATSCAAVTATGVCQYFTLPLVSGYIVPSLFSWSTVYTGSPTGTTVNLEGSIDGRSTMDVGTTASSTTITSATMKFTAADVGKTIYVSGAGTGAAVLKTTISSVTNATTAVMAASAVLSTVNTVAFVGTFYQLDQSTATAGEFRSVSNKPVRYVRCNVSVLSGGTTPTATCSFIATGQ